MGSLDFRFRPRSTIRNPTRRVVSMAVLCGLAGLWIASARPGISRSSTPPAGPAFGTRALEPDVPGSTPPSGLIESKPAEKDTGDDPARRPLTEADVEFLLEMVQDQKRDIGPALYYHYLDRARRVPLEELIAQGRRDVTLASLYREPTAGPRKYRGQLVTISGIARRIESAEVGDNAYGLKRRYELWIFTEDSGPYPWVAVTTELPPGLPIGTDVNEPVTVAGYFLQLWAYRASDGFRSAPLILGRSVRWTPRPAPPGDPLGPYLVGTFVVFAALVVGGVLWLMWGDLRFRRSAVARRLTDPVSAPPERFELPDDNHRPML